jgi:hypothetical protein
LGSPSVCGGPPRIHGIRLQQLPARVAHSEAIQADSIPCVVATRVGEERKPIGGPDRVARPEQIVGQGVGIQAGIARVAWGFRQPLNTSGAVDVTSVTATIRPSGEMLSRANESAGMPRRIGCAPVPSACNTSIDDPVMPV